MEEHWRDIPGYEGKYQISIDTPEGKCRSLNYHSTGKPHLLNNCNGRIYWDLSKNGKSLCRQAARWIAFTFPELVQNDYFDGAVIDHIDTNPRNNHPSNLRWVTTKENCNNPLTIQHNREAQTGRKKPYRKRKPHTEEAKLHMRHPHKKRK